MNDKKHIDRLFQERFKDFEATPSDAVWKNIEAELNQNKKKRRVIPIWWQYAGVAALLALLLTIGGNYYFNEDPIQPTNVVGTEDTQTRTSTIENNTKIAVESNVTNENQLETNSSVVSKSSDTSEKTSVASTTSSSTKNLKQSIVSSNNKAIITNSNKHNQTVASSISEEKNKATNTVETENNSKNKETLITSEKAKKLITSTTNNANEVAKVEEKNKNSRTIEEALNDAEDNVAIKKDLNKWRIAPNVAPVYFNSLGQGSSIDSQFNNNSKTGEVNMSYGISASYVVTDKLKVRSGINKVNLGYNTNNVVIYQSVGLSSSTRSLENITVNANASDNVSVISGNAISARPEDFTTINTSINQAFAYIEVPLEVQYTLVNTKLGVNLVGGFSSFFLSDNKVYSEAETGTRTYLGKANNINNVSYSANFGIGLNYQVTKKLDLNLEPMFKYQINTFDNTSGNFTPYFIGVYTGFAIKF